MSNPVVPMCDQLILVGLVNGNPIKRQCDRPAKHYKDETGENVFLCDVHAESRQRNGDVLVPYRQDVF